MNFGDKLKKLRCDANMTQDELAGKLFVSRTAVSKWETGRGLPAIDSLKAIAELFGVTVDYLVSDEDVEREKSAAKLRGRRLYVSAAISFAAAAVLCTLYCFFRHVALLVTGCAMAVIFVGFALFAKPRYGASGGGAAARIIPKFLAAALVLSVAAITIIQSAA